MTRRWVTILVAVAGMVLFFAALSYASRGVGVYPVSPTGEMVKGNQWMFVIGIDTYIEWPRLKTAVNDAKSVKNVLLDRYYFNEDNVIELYDAEATRSNILQKLRFLAKNVKEDDSLFIFYAGHGHLDSITKAGSWIPVESSVKDTSAWISNHDIKNYLKVDAIKARHILLVSDSCFSGDFFRGHRGKLPEVTDQVVKKAYTRTSRQAITSGGLEPVSDAGFGGNSVFSYFFVNALKENQKPYLISSDLYPIIRAGVAENAAQFPQLGAMKDTGGSQGGEFIFFLKQDSRLDDLSDEAFQRRNELERLQQMEAEDEAAKRREAEEIARKEKELAEYDAKINAMRKRLGTSAVQSDDNLDNMLAMVQQKEEQEKRLNELRKQREVEEQKRQQEIDRLQRESDEKIIISLKPEVEKYKIISSSKYGKDLEAAAWQSLISKCPPGWAEGVNEGETELILMNPKKRQQLIQTLQQKKLCDEKRLEAIDYCFGITQHINYNKSRSLFLETNECDDPLAIMWQARSYQVGKYGYEKDTKKAEKMAEKVLPKIINLADDGNSEAMFLLGSAYNEGIAVRRDSKKAFEWFKKSAEFGSPFGMTMAGYSYEKGKGIRKNYEEAFKWYAKAAEAGLPAAMTNFGYLYYAGKGVQKNKREAIKWFRRAAEKGNEKAKENLDKFRY